MGKRCGKCGFVNNPDDAHYCGKCGNKFDFYSNWKVYDSSYYTPVRNSTLTQYKQYEEKVKSSWFIDPWGKLKKWREESKGPLIITCIVTGVVFIVVAVCSFLIPDGCSSTEKKLTRIEVNGKYGIGYDKDHLLVSAEYDSISEHPIGTDQWLIKDRTRGRLGLAYVTDSLRRIIAPEFTDIRIGRGRYSLLRISPKPSYQSDEYEFVTKDGHIMNETAFHGIKAVGDFSDFAVFVDRQSNSKYQLYDRNLDKIGSEYDNIWESFDGDVLVAQGSDEGVIYDLTGNRTNQRSMYRVNNFSDGVGWAYVTKSDYQNGQLSLIDKYGKTLYSKMAKPYSPAIVFSDGVGWYKNVKDLWVAVDKSGKELFKIEASHVFPFTMGIAPIYKGKNYSDRKLGFVDKMGHSVIPFKYESIDQPKFGKDSLMTVKLDGKKGKLHRNGTFYPDK